MHTLSSLAVHPVHYTRLFPLLFAAILLAQSSSGAMAETWDVRSDTWVASDALGRSLPTFEEVGPPRSDRFVGIFYFLWLGQHGRSGPYNISEILDASPTALDTAISPLWGAQGAFHHWAEPLFGYYVSNDEYVLRKHAQMLADAGVDTLIFDVTNRFTYRKCYEALLHVFTEVRANGGKTPGVVFLTPFWDPVSTVQQLYKDLYAPGLHRDLWFEWEGKPLIMADPSGLDPEIQEFFTFRKPIPGYMTGPSGSNQWGWLEVYPQNVFPSDSDPKEQMTVGVAQNAWGTHTPAAFSEAVSHSRNCYGRSWHNSAKDTAPSAVDRGLNYGEQWTRALEVDPRFIFITGWNEWVASNLPEFNTVKHPVMFVDTFNQEYSRDTEPMKGGHADNYYYQTIANIRRFKGVREIPTAEGKQNAISIDGEFNDWVEVIPEFRDQIGDPARRDHPAWEKGRRYVNNSGRNDLVLHKVAWGPESISFYVRTETPITSWTDPHWMTLLIDIDCDHSTGWEGYDYAVNRTVTGATQTSLEKNSRNWSWKHCATIEYRVSGNEMELAIPRSALTDISNTDRFDFKWVDNYQAEGDILDFTVNGDSAPNDRYNYRFVLGTQ